MRNSAPSSSPRRADLAKARDAFAGLPVHEIATLRGDGKLVIEQGGKTSLMKRVRPCECGVECHQHRDPAPARQPRLCRCRVRPRKFDDADVGLTPRVLFDATVNVAAPMIATGLRPKVAILREQGVNSHIETGHVSRWLASMPTMYNDRPADRSSHTG